VSAHPTTEPSGTPVAEPAVVAPAVGRLVDLDAAVTRCAACPRLVAWRGEVAANPRAAFAGEDYWGRAVPGFGPATARLWVVGLAPAAHGANRTGRMFTGDRSGDWLFAALWRAGLATAPTSTAVDDGTRLVGTRITSAVHCAPPANRPTAAERRRCAPWLAGELALLRSVRVVLALGRLGHDAVCDLVGLRPRPRFAHGAEVRLPDGLVLVDSFHPSQQNTFTGRLTEEMFDDVVGRAAALAGLTGSSVR